MKKSIMAALLPLALLLGCGKQDEDTTAAPTNEAAPMQTITNPMSANSEMVLIDIDGESLTMGAAEQLVDAMLAPIRPQIPPGDVQRFREELRKRVIRDFVFETLMIQEADRKQVTVPEAEVAELREKVQEQPPPGMDVEETVDRLVNRRRIALLVENYMEKNNLFVTDDVLANFMKEHADQAVFPEEVRARHIMLNTAPDDTDEIRQSKIAHLESIRQQILDGADFSEMAAKHSEDPGSKDRGGELPRFSRDQDRSFPPSLVEAAFSQATNQVGRTFATPVGLHILEVMERSPARPMTPEQVRQNLLARNRNQAIQAVLQEAANQATIEPPVVRDMVLNRTPDPAATNATDQTPSPREPSQP